MKKNFIIILLIISMLLLVNYITSPKVIYSKINYISYKNQNIEQVEESNIENNIVIVQLHLSYDQFNYPKSINENMTLFETKEIEKDNRQEAKRYHQGNNRNINKFMSLGNYQDLYISSYSPFIDISYNYDYFMRYKNSILSNITKCEYVSEVSIIETFYDYESCIDYSCEASDAGQVYETRSKTGDGVVVGILEPGLIDDTHEDLANTNITIRSHASNLVASKTHTTKMALIIGGDHGVAPGVSILNANLTGTMNDEIDWMLDNDVEIINMSFMTEENQGTYNATSAYADYISYTYNVIIVAAAGNNGEGTGYIGNPGLGYNVITVGSVSPRVESSSFSSYKVNDGPIKPTICTTGSAVELLDNNNTSVTGTSAAAALCTGYISLLLEDYPSLAMDKARLLSLMSVNSFYNENQDFTEDNGFDYLVGAGMFSYSNMIDNYYQAINITNSSGVADSFVYERQLYLYAGDVIRACVSVEAKSTGTVNSLDFTDYDIFIGNSSDYALAYGNSYNSTVDMVMYTVPTSGYYTIKVYQGEDRVNTYESLGIAYSITN